MSSPAVAAPATFAERAAWVQQRVRSHVRPYHFAIAVGLGLITVVFIGLIAVLLLISTNFNLLDAIE